MSMTYRIVPAPKLASMRTWDCARCGRAEVKPVFLDGGNGTVAFGTGCAAVVLGYPKPAAVRREFDAVEFAARQAEELLADRRARYSTALAAFENRVETFVPELEGARKTYHASGGSTVLGSFPAWLARVAATGELD